MATNPWTGRVLPRKTVELIAVGLNAACTALHASGTRRHIRAALAAGATRDELLTVLKMAAMLAIHSCSLGAPLLLAAAQERRAHPDGRGEPPVTPACDAMREMGQWNAAWDPFFALDPAWTEQFMAAALDVYVGGVLAAKDVELLSIAFDASVRHMYAPGADRHVRGALAAGASPEEVMEVLQILRVVWRRSAPTGSADLGRRVDAWRRRTVRAQAAGFAIRAERERARFAWEPRDEVGWREQ